MDTHINAYWTIVISLIFAYTFYNIYLHEKKDPDIDVSGIKYLTVVLLIWALSGIFSVVYHYSFERVGNASVEIAYRFLNTVFSIGNSAFILLAIPSIQIEKRLVREIFKKDVRNVLVYAFIVLFGTVAIAVLIFYVYKFIGEADNIDEFLKRPIHFVGILDLLFAFIVIWELIIRMMQAFKERNLKFMIPVSWAFIAFIFVAQVLEVLPAFINAGRWDNYVVLQHISFLAYRTLLIALFILLSYSWQLKKNKEYIATTRIQQENKLLEKDKVIKDLMAKINRYRTTVKRLKYVQQKIQSNGSSIPKITQDDLEKLTEREKEVFKSLADGLSYKAIGKTLYIARETVISNVRSIEKKLGLKGKEKLVEAAKTIFLHK